MGTSIRPRPRCPSRRWSRSCWWLVSERQSAEFVAALEGFTVEGVGEPLSDEDFVRAYVRRYNWDWCEPIEGLWRGYAVVDADEDDPPIFECAFAADAQGFVRVMRWLRTHFDGRTAPPNYDDWQAAAYGARLPKLPK